MEKNTLIGTNTVIPKVSKSLYPPTVIETHNGKFAIFGDVGWVKVPASFTMEDAISRWVRTMPTVSKRLNVEDRMMWSVNGSKGNEYTVTKYGNVWSCTCPGFGFRQKCKHVDSIKEIEK